MPTKTFLELRRERGYSAADLAKASGCNRQLIDAAARGALPRSRAFIITISQALGVSEAELRASIAAIHEAGS